MRKKSILEDEGIQMCISIILFVAIMLGIVHFINWRAEQQAQSINSMTGSNLTADDVILNGDKIIVIPK